MTTLLSDHEILTIEQSMNAAYLDALSKKARTNIEIGMAANEFWVGKVPAGPKIDPQALIGRVARGHGDDQVIALEYYIGPRCLEVNGRQVYSWAARIADTFFHPREGGHELTREVAAVRTFVVQGQRVVHVAEERIRDMRGWEPFRQRTPLHVPAPPSVSVLPSSSARPGAETSDCSDGPSTSAASESTIPSGQSASSAGSLEQGMRAVDAVRFVIAQPRTKSLTSVLATLQPDQHDLVTRDPSVNLIIQGHPGTGKTVVAAHRAAYLVNSERDVGRQVSRVLLLGPTREWVDHVRGILTQLDHGRCVAVVDIVGLMMRAASVRQAPVGALDGLPEVLEPKVGQWSGRIVHHLRAAQGWKPSRHQMNLAAAYSILRAGRGQGFALVLEEDERSALQSLPEIAQAQTKRSLLPLVARVALEVRSSPPEAEKFDHVIVDEAQDLTRLEWDIIQKYSRSQTWTVVGDMNQRRADRTYASWSQLSNDLAFDDGTNVLRPQVLSRGYRSTQQILSFADGLLPSSQRGARTLQTGPEVQVRRVRRGTSLGELAVAEASRLVMAHPAGTTAIIGVDFAVIFKALQTAGWRKGADAAEWTRDELMLAVRSPETARGVEFDAVVVVEPGHFPRNIGREGPLYTSLTRANRELSVVYESPLPDGLRHAARAAR